MNLFIEQKDKILTAGYAPAPFMLDYRKKLSIATLANYLVHTAELHAERNGFGVEKLQSKKHSWVLIRLAIELKRAIHGNSNLHISTWVDKIFGITTLRCYQIAQDDEVIGYASSVWSAIDLEKRSPVRMTEIFPDKNIEVTFEHSIEAPQKLPSFSPFKYGLPFEVGYSSMDINKHFNSMRYIERCFDILPLEEALPETGFCKRAVMNFNKEALHGERLVAGYCKDAVNDSLYHLSITRVDEPETVLFAIDYYR
ncbi:hypothetical protein HR11_07580 [Porphyromonas macacae]|uniref:Acyl-ACP thioesterase n=1 Tax=Porphyromonas macacae TaxID=28115 RepID=A0A0A2G9U6_9PORP|nr:acyl-ACP thioesterase domain-containing protein [Porphyromonas macacae]KGN72921.1 hypothetical protein HQ47_08640 [Porphyromonas macacae]KGO00049.1 hypothetical protein HR11_07580 [Porphyromonas macacae]SUB89378.1 Acyl-ACP thioesterase [Porphyromonas macacae]